ncbi:hypothetical protein OROHE_023107 [Orobanche hederae]
MRENSCKGWRNEYYAGNVYCDWLTILSGLSVYIYAFSLVTSSKSDPATYLTYTKALYDHYMEAVIQGAGLPLVINTPGWVKGIGYEILVEMLRYMSATHVVKLQRSAQSRNLPDGAFW